MEKFLSGVFFGAVFYGLLMTYSYRTMREDYHKLKVEHSKCNSTIMLETHAEILSKPIDEQADLSDGTMVEQ